MMHMGNSYKQTCDALASLEFVLEDPEFRGPQRAAVCEAQKSLRQALTRMSSAVNKDAKN